MGFPFGVRLPGSRPTPAARAAGRRAGLVAALVVIALLCAGRPAQAGTITAQLNGTGLDGIINPGADVTINVGNGSTPNVAYHPGVVNWTLISNNSSLPFASHFTTFCIELTQDISPGNPYTYTLTDLANAPKPGTSQTGNGNGMGATKATEISELWAKYYSSIGTSGTNAAAFQLAIWKIEYDWNNLPAQGTDFFTSGNFQASGNAPVTQLATTWLTYLEQHPNLPQAVGLVALTSPGSQDQVTQVLPAPPGLCLAGAGALCLGGFVWFRRRVAFA
jgi:hypothetical protein